MSHCLAQLSFASRLRAVTHRTPNGVQNLDQEAYTKLMGDVYTAMLALLTLADIHARAINTSVASILEGKEAQASASSGGDASSSAAALNVAWTNALQSDLGDSVQAAAELINVRIARIVASRGEVHSRLSLPEFYKTFSDSWQFVLDCEILSRKMIVGLRGVIVGQVSCFLALVPNQTDPSSASEYRPKLSCNSSIKRHSWR